MADRRTKIGKSFKLLTLFRTQVYPLKGEHTIEKGAFRTAKEYETSKVSGGWRNDAAFSKFVFQSACVHVQL